MSACLFVVRAVPPHAFFLLSRSLPLAETVYGLGANALNVDAVLSIFAHKGRPLTDPLIVHVPDLEAALRLIELDPACEAVYRALAARFWPGPLTLVAKAGPSIPPQVTAGTGFVGVRVPAHATARALLVAAGVPVAAPSANRFGHVSPTRAVHVADDLGACPIGLVLGEGVREYEEWAAARGAAGGPGGVAASTASSSGPVTCSVGIESTVVKVEAAPGDAGGRLRVVVFRRGGVSVSSLRAALAAAGFGPDAVDVTVQTMHVSGAAGGSTPAVTTAASSASIEGGAQAPGMLLTHYAPNVDTYLVVEAAGAGAGAGAGAELQLAASPASLAPVPPEPLGDGHSTFVVDFGGALRRALPSAFVDSAAGYIDLSPGGSIAEAQTQLFAALRASEATAAGASRVLLMDPVAVGGARGGSGSSGADEAEAEALRDRMLRAASGRLVVVS